MEPQTFSARLTAGLYLLLVLLLFFLGLVYAATRQMWLLGLLVFPLLALVAVHLLGRVTGEVEERNRREASLTSLATALVPLTADRPGLRQALVTYLPEIFPGCRVTLWADEETVLFDSGEGVELPLAVMNVRLSVEHAGYMLWSSSRQDPAGWLVAMPDWPEGGLYVCPRPDQELAIFLEPAQQVAQGVGALLARDQALAASFEEQAESYEEAIFNEAYRAEMLAQTLMLRKIEQELDTAWQIQASLLPATPPDLAGWQVVAELEPARQMSGDFYDFIPLPGGLLGVVVADVADKGLGPALYMALCRTLIRSYAEVYPTRPEQVLAAANRRILNETTSDLFVTVFYAVLDPYTGRIQYCNAGHNPPLLFQGANGTQPEQVQALTRTALPLGILDDLEATHGEREIAAGDLLVLYTDGITEAQDEGEGFYGEQRLRDLIWTYRDRPAQIVGEKVVTAVYDFMGEAPQFDDITLVLVSRDGK